MEISQPLECAEGFFYDQNGTGLCRPECGQFQKFSLAVVKIEQASIVTGFVASVVMAILALTYLRKIM